MLQDPIGSLEFEPSREALLIVTGLIAALIVLAFFFLVFMFEVSWRQHPPPWMLDRDEEDSSIHEPDVHG